MDTLSLLNREDSPETTTDDSDKNHTETLSEVRGGDYESGKEVMSPTTESESSPTSVEEDGGVFSFLFGGKKNKTSKKKDIKTVGEKFFIYLVNMDTADLQKLLKKEPFVAKMNSLLTTGQVASVM